VLIKPVERADLTDLQARFEEFKQQFG
jgi:hypothetical protein